MRIVVIGIRSRIVVGIRRRLVHDHGRGLISWYINNFRRGRFNLDDLFFHDDDLFIVGIQIPRRVGLITKLLDSIHDVTLLIGYSRTQFPGPVQILVQQVDHFWII